MDDIPILSRNDDRNFFKQVLGHYDAPAFVRRAQRMQDAYDQVIAACRRRREEWLETVRLRLGTLQGLAGDWAALRQWLANEEQIGLLQHLHTLLEPQLRLPVNPTSSARGLHRALRELRDSIGQFNKRWRDFLHRVDLTRVNQLRDGYNRYYLLEKECAIHSPRLARQGYRRMEPLTVDQLSELLPPLPMPEFKE